MMARKEHQHHVRDLLAQAIVHKTLDMERTRQVQIKKKLEEIAKIELVNRVKVSVRRSLGSFSWYVCSRFDTSRISCNNNLMQSHVKTWKHTWKPAKKL